MGRKKKYFTEEEKKAAKRETGRRWRETHPDYGKQYYQDNKEEIDERNKQYRQEHKEEIAERKKQYYQDNKEEIDEYKKQYQQEHKEEITEYHKQYRQTPLGRAHRLLGNYRIADKEMGRGKCTLTAQWIVDNIFTQKCHWCPETDWRELGCDRIDNSLPHTPDNVIPCCERCNKNRGKKTYDEYKKALRAEETTL